MLPKLMITYVKILSLLGALRHRFCNKKTEEKDGYFYRFLWVLCQEGVQLLVSACPGNIAGYLPDWRSHRLWLQQREVTLPVACRRCRN